jgi:hypothetical protein
MSAGDILNPKRARTQANERLDTVDTEALSSATRSFLDAYSRAVEAIPRNVGSSTPVGLIFQGFGLTLNPTSPSDAKIRVQSPVGVAFDSDGRMLIKEAGVTTDLTLSAGNSQVYAFFIETAGDTTVRREITVSSPYVEGGNAIPTSLKGDVAYWVRTGDQTSIVSTDVVNGKTTALCFLGIVNNTGGAITMTGYDAVNAPNGAYAVNRLSSILAPGTAPPANTATGTVTAVADMIKAIGFYLGKAVWAGSAALTPSAANNFGAYQSPPSWSLQRLAEAVAANVATFTTTVHTFTTSGTYTPSANVAYIKVEITGAGGGGGGASAPGGGILSGMVVSAGGGGDSGVYARFTVPGPITSGGAVTIGAGGARGSGSVAGSVGGSTQININGQLLIAGGGVGGQIVGPFQSDSGASTIAITQRSAVSTSTDAVLRDPVQNTLGGYVEDMTYMFGGVGMAAYYTGTFAPSPPGQGAGGVGGCGPLGIAQYTVALGNNQGDPPGFGTGGSGAAVAQGTAASVSFHGGNGAPGFVRITEYFRLV